MIKKQISKNILTKTGSHFVLPSVGYIPSLVKDINDMNISLNKKYIN